MIKHIFKPGTRLIISGTGTTSITTGSRILVLNNNITTFNTNKIDFLLIRKGKTGGNRSTLASLNIPIFYLESIKVDKEAKDFGFIKEEDNTIDLLTISDFDFLMWVVCNTHNNIRIAKMYCEQQEYINVFRAEEKTLSNILAISVKGRGKNSIKTSNDLIPDPNLAIFKDKKLRQELIDSVRRLENKVRNNLILDKLLLIKKQLSVAKALMGRRLDYNVLATELASLEKTVFNMENTMESYKAIIDPSRYKKIFI